MQTRRRSGVPAGGRLNRRWLSFLVLSLGLLGIAGSAVAFAASTPRPVLIPRAVAPQVMRAADTPTPLPTATPTATPTPYAGPVESLYLASAGIGADSPVEVRDTTFEGGREVFQDPSEPGRIAWYARFGHPGSAGTNSVFAAHINYFGYGNGPFAHLLSAQPEDALYVKMADGETYAYTVISVSTIPLSDLQSGGMDGVVYPPLDSHTERVTLISCGGDFVPFANGSGAGEYTSRVVLVAERYIP